MTSQITMNINDSKKQNLQSDKLINLSQNTPNQHDYVMQLKTAYQIHHKKIHGKIYTKSKAETVLWF